MGKQLDGLDELIEGFDLHDATTSEKSCQNGAVAGERAGVRPDHDLPGGGLPGLEKNDRFALRQGGAGDLLELARILQRFDHHGDDAHLRIVNERLDEILDGGTKLIPAGDKIGEA